MRTINNKTARSLRPTIAAATGVLVVALALNVMVRLAHTTPHLGDIVAFAPSATAPADDGARLLVHRQDQFGCVLDLNVLRRSGGSMVLETQLSVQGNNFSVHWAGTRTSDDPGNCGSDADLILDRLDLEILSLAAGGYGMRPGVETPVVMSNSPVGN
jgi:hypothetical protein